MLEENTKKYFKKQKERKTASTFVFCSFMQMTNKSKKVIEKKCTAWLLFFLILLI